MQQVSREQVTAFRQDIQQLMRRRLREAVEMVLEEELSLALGPEWYERSAARRGYRHGVERRRVTTAQGTRKLAVPRGRLVEADGSTKEFRSTWLPRYARRTREIDEAILACYLAGANSRRIRKALAPLLGEEHLSKSAVSRVVGRLKELFAAWLSRDLSGEPCAVVFLDGFHLKPCRDDLALGGGRGQGREEKRDQHGECRAGPRSRDIGAHRQSSLFGGGPS